jgi:hypothetical protein
MLHSIPLEKFPVAMTLWADCQHLDVSTWLGRPPSLRPADFAFVRPTGSVPRNFAHDFNSTGPRAIERAIAEKAILSSEPHYVGPMLLYCDGIRPAAVTQYAFLRPTEAQTLFYCFFSAANLDFMSLPDAFRLLLSRVALPEDRSSLFIIFNAFADAYAEANQYIAETREEVCKLAIAAVILSMTKRKNECLSQMDFMKRVEQVRCADKYKVFVHSTLKEKPIVLYFTTIQFVNEPETVRRGSMSKSRTLFTKTKQFCVLSAQTLKIYKDQGCTDQAEEVPLYNVTVTFVAAKDKEPARMVIASKDGLPFGSSFKKGQRRPGKKSQYEFSGTKDETELKQWVDLVKFWGLYVTFIQMTNMSPKSE